MTKKQLKERALLLFILSFLMEGLNQAGLINEKTKDLEVDMLEVEDSNDMLVLNLYKKLKRLRPSYANEKVSSFMYKRIESVPDELSQECQPILMGLIGVYFYQKFKRTNEFDLGINPKKIENIFKDLANVHSFKISPCTINRSIKIIEAIYPDEKGLIEFYRLTNRFPFNIKTKE